MSFDPTTLNDNVASAPEAGFAPLNYGQLIAEANVVVWGGEKDARVKSVRPLKKGEKLGKAESLELAFSINLSEFNPALEFSYTRSVPVRKSSAREKTDWTEITEPSLVSVLGANWPMVLAQSPYVCVEDVPNVAGKVAKSGKPYGVPKIVARYRNAAECGVAREKQFGGSGGTTHSNGEIPAAIITQAKALGAAVPDEAQLRTLLAMEPYAGYDTELLMEAITTK